MFIGIDVSKNYLDIQSHCNTVAMAKVDLNNAISTLLEHHDHIQIVVLEATGGYERPLRIALANAGIPFFIANPRRVRAFAQAIGITAKTDRMDAHVLATIAASLKPQPSPIDNLMDERLKSLVTRRNQLSAILTAENNRMKMAYDDDVKLSLISMTEAIKDQINALTIKITKHIQHNPLAEKLQSVKGIGTLSAAGCLAFLPELGQLGRKQIASLAGVAPMTRQSGQWTGKAYCQGGRKQVRQVLYMATLVATRYNPVISDFYQKLLMAGKAKKCALNACMRKLLIHLNAIARKHYETIAKTLYTSQHNTITS